MSMNNISFSIPYLWDVLKFGDTRDTPIIGHPVIRGHFLRTKYYPCKYKYVMKGHFLSETELFYESCFHCIWTDELSVYFRV